MLSTLDKVKQLKNYFANNNVVVDPVVDRTINKLLNREYDRLGELKSRLINELSEFERRYSLPTDDFHRQYETGELGDDMDFIEWAATIEMLTNVRKQLDLLEVVSRQ
jgi:hypothetical protein